MDLSKYAAGKKKYLSKELYKPGPMGGETLTIATIREIEVSNRGGTTEKKALCEWVEDRPSLILNKGNLQVILEGFGPTEKDYQGQKVYVYHDPNVMLADKRVGGIRLQKIEAKEELSDDIPF